jgi:hypothetical protein
MCVSVWSKQHWTRSKTQGHRHSAHDERELKGFLKGMIFYQERLSAKKSCRRDSLFREKNWNNHQNMINACCILYMNASGLDQIDQAAALDYIIHWQSSSGTWEVFVSKVLELLLIPRFLNTISGFWSAIAKTHTQSLVPFKLFNSSTRSRTTKTKVGTQEYRTILTVIRSYSFKQASKPRIRKAYMMKIAGEEVHKRKRSHRPDVLTTNCALN